MAGVIMNKYKNDPDYGDYKHEERRDSLYLNQAVPQKVVAQIFHDMHGKKGPVKLVDGNKVINDIIKEIKGD
jgi:hypothetical protein